MKVLVTGGAGFIGSNLVRFLLEDPEVEVVNLDKLTYAGNLESLSSVSELPAYSFEKVDLLDKAGLERVFSEHQPDCVLHLAAESHVDRSVDSPTDFIQTNVVGTCCLLDAALRYWRSRNEFSKFRFLHVSTDEVYGSLELDSPGFSEATRYDPHSPYSASKAASDHFVRAWHDTYGLPVLITNCSNNYGPYQFPEKLIPLAIFKCLKGEKIPVYGTGENIRDWLYVEDHVDALCRVLRRGRVGTTYNIGGNCERKIIDVVTALCELLDELRPSERSYADLIEYVEDRPGHDLRYAIDATKIKDELGWEPTENFESGLRKTVEWYLQNRSWGERILDGSYKLERLGQFG